MKWLTPILLCALAFIPSSATAGISTGHGVAAAWSWANPLAQGNTLNDLAFPSATAGFAVGDSGTILKTVNGAGSWSSLDEGTKTQWNGVAFPTVSDGWIVGASGNIRRTANAGTTWVSQRTGGSSLRSVAATGTSNAIAVGDGGSIVYTTNGSAWVSATSGTTLNLSSVSFVDTGSGPLAWAVGASGTMLRSANGGTSWSAITPLTGQGLNSVVLAPGTTIGYAVGNAGASTWTAFKTTNGTSWTALTLPGTPVALTGVATSANGLTVVVTGASGVVYRSTDGGVTWTARNPARYSSAVFHSVKILSGTDIVVCGEWGAMLRSRTNGQSWLSAMQYGTISIKDVAFPSATVGFAVSADGSLMRTLDGGVSWSARKTAGVTFESVDFTSATTGWAVGSGGAIYQTTNGGATWTALTSPTTNHLWHVSFVPGSTNGAACGDGGVVLTTTNGTTWTSNASALAVNTQPLYSISRSSASQIDACGANGVILRCTNADKGASFTLRSAGTTTTFRAIWAFDAKNVLTCGDGGVVAYSTNGSSWTLGTSGTTENLTSVHLVTATNGWVAGSNGTVLYTNNNGSTWTSQSAAAGFPSSTADRSVTVRAIWATSATSVFALGDNGEIRQSADTGVTWAPFEYGTSQTLYDVSAPTTQTAWAVGANGTIVNSFDGGATWYQQVSGAAIRLMGVHFETTQTGWAVGANGTIRKTSDGGWNWSAQTSGVTNLLNDVSAGSESAAVAVGVGGTVRTTTDGGTTWVAATTVPTTNDINSVDMVSATVGWAAASAGSARPTILKTTDGGVTWVAKSTGVNLATSLYGVTFSDATHGCAVGAGGAIYHTIDGGESWTLKSVSGVTADLQDVSFSGAAGVAAGDSGVVLKTTDYGATWSAQDSGATVHNLYAASLSSELSGFLVGTQGAILGYYDATPPTTTLQVSPSSPNGTNGWYRTTPQVTLAVNEPATSYYRWGGSGAMVQYSAQLAVDEGTHTIDYFSVDRAGNQEATQTSAAFHVDVSAPTAPSSLAPSAVTSANASFTWAGSADSTSGVAYYTLYLDGSAVATSAGTAATATGLNPNHPYQALVTATDNAGNESGFSNAYTFWTDYVGGALHTSVQVTPSSPNALGWYTSVPQSTFSVYPADTTATVHYEFTDGLARETTPTTYLTSNATGTVTPVAQGWVRLWYYARDDASLLPSETVQFRDFQIDTSKPSTPATISVIPLTLSYASVSLRWDTAADAQSGIHHYNVYAQIGSETPWLVTGSAASEDATNLAIVGLTQGTTYTFYVCAVNGAGVESDPSGAVTVTTTYAQPAPPVAAFARALTGEAVAVNWAPITSVGAVSYHVWRSNNGIDYSVVATQTGRLSNTYLDMTVQSSTRYWYAVSALDDFGVLSTPAESDLRVVSSDTTVTLPTRGILSEEPTGSVMTTAPERLSKPVVAITGATAIHLTWPPSIATNVGKYRVYRGETSMGQSALVSETALPEYTDLGLTSGKTYFYRVSVVDTSDAESLKSVEVAALPQASLPASPHGTPGTTQAGCNNCHANHQPGASQDRKTECVACHNGSDGLNVASLTATPAVTATSSAHYVDTAGKTTQLQCLTCHRGHQLPGDTAPGLLAVDGKTSGASVCLGCHGASSTLASGDMSAYTTSVHNVTLENDSRNGINCQNCHRSHGSPNPQLLKYADYMVCMQCHAGNGDPDRPDILSLVALGDPSTRHPLTKTDQQITGARLECRNCHNTHVVQADHKLVDPENPSPQGTWAGNTDTFCLKCHDGTLPTAQQTGRWAPAPLAHGGSMTTTDYASTWQTAKHGYGTSTTATNLHLRADMGYDATGTVMPCIVCHDMHGSVNAYSLRSSMKSANGQKTVSGMMVVPVPGGGYDMRFWCTSCHDVTAENHPNAGAGGADLTVFPMNCVSSQCHAFFGSHF